MSDLRDRLQSALGASYRVEKGETVLTFLDTKES